VLQRTVDWWFRDRETGRIVIGQAPNPSLLIAMVLFAGRWVAARAQWSQGLQQVLDAGFALAMVWWAGREVLQGVNPFRRLLGVAVLVLVIGSRVL
jgi:hypothetical protein